MKQEKQSETTKSPSDKHLLKMYWEVRRKWLKSENTDFDDDLADFFDEFEAYMNVPVGN